MGMMIGRPPNMPVVVGHTRLKVLCLSSWSVRVRSSSNDRPPSSSSTTFTYRDLQDTHTWKKRVSEEENNTTQEEGLHAAAQHTTNERIPETKTNASASRVARLSAKQSERKKLNEYDREAQMGDTKKQSALRRVSLKRIVLVSLPRLVMAFSMSAALTIGPYLAQPRLEALREVYGEVAVFGLTSVFLFTLLRINTFGKISEVISKQLPGVLRTVLGMPRWSARLIGSQGVHLCGRIYQAAYVFLLANVLCDAVLPDDMVLNIPDGVAFLLPKGAYTGKELEGHFLAATGRVLKAYVAICCGMFMHNIKDVKPQEDENDQRSRKAKELSEDDGPIARYVMALRGDLSATTKHARLVGVALLCDRVLDFSIVCICITQVLGIFGVSLKTLIAVAGVGALAISISARPLVQNLIGGLTIFLLNPFSLNEFIVTKEIQGYVESIGWLSTSVRTTEGVQLVPNDKLVDETLLNRSRLPEKHFEVSTDTLYLVPIDPRNINMPVAIREMTRALRQHPRAFGGQAIFKGTTSTGVLAIDIHFSVASKSALERATKRSEVLAHMYETSRQQGLTNPTTSAVGAKSRTYSRASGVMI